MRIRHFCNGLILLYLLNSTAVFAAGEQSAKNGKLIRAAIRQARAIYAGNRYEAAPVLKVAVWLIQAEQYEYAAVILDQSESLGIYRDKASHCRLWGWRGQILLETAKVGADYLRADSLFAAALGCGPGPESPRWWLGRARCARKVGDTAAATDYLSRAEASLPPGPSSVGVLAGIAYAYYTLREEEYAAFLLDSLPEAELRNATVKDQAHFRFVQGWLAFRDALEQDPGGIRPADAALRRTLTLTARLDHPSEHAVFSHFALGRLWQDYRPYVSLSHYWAYRSYQFARRDTARMIKAVDYCASALYELGDYAQARGEFALEERLSRLSPRSIDSNGLLGLYNNIAGNFGQLGQSDSAVFWYRKALAIVEGEGVNAGSEDIYYNLGLNYLKAGMPDSAVWMYERNVAIQGNTDRGKSARAWAALAHARARQGDGDAGEAARDRCRALLKGLPAGNPGAVIARLQLADRADELGEEGEALMYLDAIIKALRPAHGGDLSEAHMRMELLQALSRRTSLYRRMSGNGYLFRAAVQDAFDALDLVRGLRKDLQSEVGRLNLSAETQTFIGEGLEALYRLDPSGRNAELNEQAFRMIGAAKSLSLMETITADRRGQAYRGDSVFQAFLERGEHIRMKLTYYQAKEGENSVGDSLQHWREARGRFLLDLAERYPEYYRLRYDFGTVQLKDFQEALPESSLFADYFLTDSAVFLLCIEEHRSRLYRRPAGTVFNLSLAGFIDLVSHPPQTKTDSAICWIGSYLYGKLIKGTIAATAARLIIAPHEDLSYLPFGALVTDAKDIPTESHFVAESQALSYDYSSVMWMQRRTEPYHGGSGILVVSPSYPTMTQLKQARALAGRLPRRFIDVQHLDGASATAEAFVQEAESRSWAVMDLATHGKAREGQSPALYFAGQGGETRLELHDIYGLKLDVGLAILQACETGKGDLERGEGVFSLARGFTAARCKSVMMSLWEVNDASAEQIVEGLYAGLANGLEKDLALAKARQDYLRSKSDRHKNRFRHPYYWASLVLTGNPEPLLLERQAREPSLYVSAGGLLLLLLMWWRRRRRLRYA